MENVLNKYKEIFDVAKKTAEKWHRDNQPTFVSNNYEARDLVQEMQIIVLQIIEKYRGKEITEIFRRSNDAIEKQLIDILRKCRNRYAILCNNGKQKKVVNNLDQDGLKREAIEQALSELFEVPLQLPPDELTAEGKNDFSRFKAFGFRLEDFHTFLNEKEYDIMFEVFKNGSTFARLSEKYDCSESSIRKTYKICITKIKKYLNLK